MNLPSRRHEGSDFLFLRVSKSGEDRKREIAIEKVRSSWGAIVACFDWREHCRSGVLSSVIHSVPEL